MQTIFVIIETPKGSSEKFDYEAATGFFLLKKVMPEGMIFPCDFGFIPDTKGEDGEPLDIITLSELYVFPGCKMECRLIGALKAEQTEKNKTIRNDRFIVVPVQSVIYKKIKTVKDIPAKTMDDFTQLFINYNKAENKIFKPVGFMSATECFRTIKNSKSS